MCVCVCVCIKEENANSPGIEDRKNSFDNVENIYEARRELYIGNYTSKNLYYFEIKSDNIIQSKRHIKT